MNFKVGENVRVVSCNDCPGVVGKVGLVRKVEGGKFKLSFGRGRPQKNRPEFFTDDMLEVVVDDV